MSDWLSSLPLREIKNAAKEFKLDYKIVASIVMQESSGESFAHRYEPNYSWLYHPNKYAIELRISAISEEIAQKTSYGLMQIMGAVGRELGHRGYCPELFQDELNLHYGCKYLKKLYDRYQNENDMIASYNMGSPRKTHGGLYENEKKYVDPILRRIRELQNN